MITKTRNVESATETRETQSSETEVKLAEVYESPVDLKTIEQEISEKFGVFETDAAEGARPRSKPGIVARLANRILGLDSWLSGPPMTDQARLQQKLQEAQRDRWFLYL